MLSSGQQRNVADRARTAADIKINRILLIRFSSFGDILRFLPIAQRLRERFPQAQIDWVTLPKYRELVELCPAVDSVIGLHPLSFRGPRWSVSQSLPIWKALRAAKYDYVLDLHDSWSSWVCARISGSACINAQRDVKAAVCNNSEALTRPEDFYLTSLTHFGLSTQNSTVSFAIPPAAKLRTDRLIDALTLSEREQLVVIHPGTANQLKQWPVERFVEVANVLGARKHIRVLIVWGENELRHISTFAFPTSVLQLSNLSLPELSATIQRANVFVGNDSGPLHLAAALNVPTVAIFGPSIPAMHRPYGDGHQIIRSGLSCSPCMRPFTYRGRCPLRQQTCLTSIPVSSVINAVDVALMKPRSEEATSMRNFG